MIFDWCTVLMRSRSAPGNLLRIAEIKGVEVTIRRDGTGDVRGRVVNEKGPGESGFAATLRVACAGITMTEYLVRIECERLTASGGQAFRDITLEMGMTEKEERCSSPTSPS